MRARLWELAERHTPHERVGDYTQAIMDLGATLCTRAKPACLLCPVAGACRAHATGNPAAYPAPRPRRPYPTREKLLIVMCDPLRRVLVERRPPSGIWGGLFSFPEASAELEFRDAADASARRHGGLAVRHVRPLAPVEHGFTHFRLRAVPVVASVEHVSAAAVADEGLVRWLEPDDLNAVAADVGLAAPVGTVLSRLANEERDSR